MAAPSRRRILAVRHGESVWNVLKTQHPSEDERYIPFLYAPDCDITATGISQSRQAGVNLEQEFNLAQGGSFLMVVSPLRRALQTATHMLEGNRKLEPARMIAHPAASEVMMDSCDIGSPVKQLKQAFPQFDFGILEQHRPQFWWPHGLSREETWSKMRERDPKGGYETESMFQQRFQQLREFLTSGVECQEYSKIVVVCHSETIWHLTRRDIDGEGYGVWTNNGEIVDITSHILVNQGYSDMAMATKQLQSFDKTKQLS